MHDDNEEFRDEQHAVYLNAAYTDPKGEYPASTALAHGLKCADPDKMLIPAFKAAATNYKRTKKGKAAMTDLLNEIIEPIVDEARKEEREETTAELNERHAVAMAERGIPLDSICAVTKLARSTVCDMVSNAGISLVM